MSERKGAEQESREPELFITRVFDAPRSLVFKMWTEHEHMSKWCAPTNFTIPLCEGESRVGGTWRERMISPEGEEYSCHGEYREIVQDEKLVFTHAWDEADMPYHETLITVTFEDEGANKTRMNFCQQFFRSVTSRDGHEGGWSQAFARLGEYVTGIHKEENGHV